MTARRATAAVGLVGSLGCLAAFFVLDSPSAQAALVAVAIVFGGMFGHAVGETLDAVARWVYVVGLFAALFGVVGLAGASGPLRTYAVPVCIVGGAVLVGVYGGSNPA